MWICRVCHERLEDQFRACWNCGTLRDAAHAPDATDAASEEAARRHREEATTPLSPAGPSHPRLWRAIKIAAVSVGVLLVAEWTGGLGWVMKTVKPFPSQRAIAAIRDAGGGVDTQWRSSRSGDVRRGSWWRRALELPRVYGATLHGAQFTDDDLERLSLDGLVRLKLRETSITDDGLLTIAKLDDLREIHLVSNDQVTAAGLAPLARLRGLDVLWLHDLTITDDGLGTLVSVVRDLDKAVRLTRSPWDHYRPERTPHSTQALNLVGTDVTAAGLAPLTDLDGLRVLVLDDAQITDETLRILSQPIVSGRLSILRERYDVPRFLEANESFRGDDDDGALAQTLDLEDAPVTDAGLAHLAGATRLVCLDIRGTNVTASGAQHLARLERLRVLMADPAQLADDVLALVAAGPLEVTSRSHIEPSNRKWISKYWSWPRNSALGRALVLSRASVTDAGLAHLSGLTDLTALDLTGTLITDDGIGHLRGCTALRDLRLAGTAVTDAGLADLSRLPLHTLTVGAATTDAGLETLAAISTLRSLTLNGAKVTAAGLAHLANLPLSTLELGGTRITDAGMETIATLTELERLDLRSTRVTADGLQVVQDLPALKSLFLTPKPAFLEVAAISRPDLSIQPQHLWKQMRKDWERDAMVGVPAPDFTLPSFDGGAFRLSDHLGEIVVLDFWATWCKPCVTALRTITPIIDSFRSDGVVLYGVNTSEAVKKEGRELEPIKEQEMLESHVRAFQTEQKLVFPVAFDRGMRGRVATLYQVEGIPQTVVIGRDGTVQAIHRGAPRDRGQRLTAELRLLVRGRDLAANPLSDEDVRVEALRHQLDERTTIVESDPNDRAALIDRAELYVQLEQWNEAIADYDACRHLLEQGSFPAGDFNNLAWTYVTGPEPIRDAGKALPLIARALEMEPDDGNYFNTLGVVYHELGRMEDAREVLDYSDAINRGIPADLTFLARTHLALGDLESAGVVVDRLRARMTGGAEPKRFADELVDALETAVEREQSDVSLRTTLGGALQTAGRHEDAAAAYDAALEIDPEYARGWLRRAELHEHFSEWDDALAAFSKAIESDASLQAAWLGRGRAKAALGVAGMSLVDMIVAVGLSDEQRPALGFNGEDHVSTPHIPFDTFPAFTIEAWLLGWQGPVLSQGQAGDPENSVWLSLGVWRHSHRFSGWESGRGANGRDIGDTFAPAWNHVALAFDGEHQLIFRNGVLIDSIEAPGPGAMNRDRRLLIGAYQVASDRRKNGVGLLGALRISNTARYAADFTPTRSWSTDAQTVLLFDLTDVASEQLRDASGHERHGTIHGAVRVDSLDRSAEGP